MREYVARSIVKVIETITAVVPPENETLRTRLEKLRTSAQYTAPELMYVRWRELTSLLTEELEPTDPADWKEQVSAIITDRSES